jgi:hypothetical protein
MLDGVVIRKLEQPTVNLISSSIPLFGVQFFVVSGFSTAQARSRRLILHPVPATLGRHSHA